MNPVRDNLNMCKEITKKINFAVITKQSAELRMPSASCL